MVCENCVSSYCGWNTSTDWVSCSVIARKGKCVSQRNNPVIFCKPFLIPYSLVLFLKEQHVLRLCVNVVLLITILQLFLYYSRQLSSNTDYQLCLISQSLLFLFSDFSLWNNANKQLKHFCTFSYKWYLCVSQCEVLCCVTFWHNS